MRFWEEKGSFWEVVFLNFEMFYRSKNVNLLTFLTVVIFFCGTTCLVGQALPSTYFNAEFSVKEMRQAANYWKRSYEKDNKCKDLSYYETLNAYVKFETGEQPEFTADCGDTLWYHAKGKAAYIHHNFEIAFESFQTAAEKAKSKGFKIKLLENMGACKQMQNEFDAALFYYNQAYELSEGNESVLLQVNIAGLHAEQDNHKNAIFYSKAVLNHPDATEYHKTIARYNIISSANILDSLELASYHFNKLDKENLPPGSEWSAIKVLLKYALGQNDKTWFELLVKKHQNIILNEGEIETGEVVYLLAKAIINNNEKERDVLWKASQRDLEIEKNQYVKFALDEDLEKKFNKAELQRKKLSLSLQVLSIVIVLSLLSYLAYHYYQKKRRQKVLASIQENLTKDKSIQTIYDSLKSSTNKVKALENLLRLDRELNSYRNERSTNFKMNLLNRREAEVFHLILAEKSTQEISDTLNLSNKYIYNIRSKIKEIFKIPPKMTIEAWAKSKMED
ncbi:MAG: LuxR C-terminal-related transcriptional regulator [Bacteroidota bacterium]